MFFKSPQLRIENTREQKHVFSLKKDSSVKNDNYSTTQHLLNSYIEPLYTLRSIK